ncbi:transcription factor grauzone-like [Contarinia nasturtii]|uniref:transcription factor grauzone-like n=1 Tax=Contarinia nasturtii TaxID=265458 RepID=UPI0012D398A7|nr:transcription factor grauzone-like [Contarinia nasturtii]
MDMEKMLLCRLCLGTSANTSFVSTAQLLEVELLLEKYNILFEKRDLSTADGVNSILTQLCDLCWSKIDEFNQFCVQVENIQTTYNRQFLQDSGSYTTFEQPNQYFTEIEKIHNEFASKMFNQQIEDKKSFSFIEPFCMINVDENDVAKIASDSNQKSNDSHVKEPETLHIKEEHGNIEYVSEELNSTDILNTDELSDCDDDISYIYEEDEDEDDDDRDDDNNFSSDTSYASESKEKKRKSSGKTATKTAKLSSKSKKTSSDKISKHSKKTNKKISVTTVNVLDEDNKRLLSYVQMKCDVCSDDRVYDSFADIQTHFLDIHNQNGYIICCNRKFRRIGRVLQHCTWHDNPEAFKCDDCNKCFQDNVCLRDHITSMHIPADERRFQCDQCSRLFAKQHLLNTHLKMKHTVKEERPFVCSEGECGQRFVLPAYLRLHIEKVHNKADSRVCDVCARFFKCSKSYERHYQVEHTNIDQRVQCDLCQKWFKHLDTLKDHIRRHYAQSATCKYCGRVSSNKKSLRLHIRNLHADVDSSVKTKNEFPCTICEKIFKKKQTLREHMTLHTGEAYLYTCTFCSKTFRSSANMYAHRKRNHPVEYEEKCVLAKMQKT